MVTRMVPIDELHDHLRRVQDRLAGERTAIRKMLPIGDELDREDYVEAYMHAETFCLKTIKKHLKELSWLPIQLDPEAEMKTYNKSIMNNWVKNGANGVPTAERFGNDFIHALARAGLTYGWNDIRVARLSLRIASLFMDLSCLVGIVYYASFLSENYITALPLTDPTDIFLTVKEVDAYFKQQQKSRIIEPAPEQMFDRGENGKKDPHPYLHLVSETSVSEEHPAE